MSQGGFAQSTSGSGYQYYRICHATEHPRIRHMQQRRRIDDDHFELRSVMRDYAGHRRGEEKIASGLKRGPAREHVEVRGVRFPDASVGRGLVEQPLIQQVGDTDRVFSRGPARGLANAVVDAARGISRELGAPRWPFAG